MSSYPAWLTANGRSNDARALEDYLREVIRTEGWLAENKAAAKAVDYSVREAVCALANARGGEVFIGVTNPGKVDGTTVTLENLNEVLRQRKATPEDWFVTDLLTVCDTLPVPLENGARWAFVVQVRPPGKPVFVFEDGKYWLAQRSGSDTLRTLDSRETIRWYREWRRADILRGCYAEFVQHLGPLSQHRQFPDGSPEVLPFLQKVKETGELYRVLSERDWAELEGPATLYNRVVTRVNAELARRPVPYRNQPIRNIPEVGPEFANLEGEVSERLKQLAGYLRSQGYPV